MLLSCIVQWSEKQNSGIIYSPVHQGINSHSLIRPSSTCPAHTCTGGAILLTKKKKRKHLAQGSCWGAKSGLSCWSCLNFSRKSSSSVCFPVKHGPGARGGGLISQRLTLTLLKQQGGGSMKTSKVAASDCHSYTRSNYMLIGRVLDCVWPIRFM